MTHVCKCHILRQQDYYCRQQPFRFATCSGSSGRWRVKHPLSHAVHVDDNTSCWHRGGKPRRTTTRHLSVLACLYHALVLVVGIDPFHRAAGLHPALSRLCKRSLACALSKGRVSKSTAVQALGRNRAVSVIFFPSGGDLCLAFRWEQRQHQEEAVTHPLRRADIQGGDGMSRLVYVCCFNRFAASSTTAAATPPSPLGVKRRRGGDGGGRSDRRYRSCPRAAEERARACDGRRRQQGRLHCAAHVFQDLLLCSESNTGWAGFTYV